MHPNGGEIMP